MNQNGCIDSEPLVYSRPQEFQEKAIMSELDGLKLLRRIEEGVAGKTGDAFFRQVVCDLSRALGAHGAFTSRLLPERRARMLAFWVGGAYETCLEYALVGTPCEFVYRGEITAYARNVGEVFPVDREWFAQLGVQSYLGVPLKDETGAVYGHFAVMDTRERDWAEADIDVLRLFSLRAAAEIERTRYQRELEEAKAAAENANRSKSVFISQMSHELRTPLNGILGFAQLLRRDPLMGPERINEGLAVIERSGEHLLKLVNDLLDLAKIEAGKLELSLTRVDLAELLEHVASLARVRASNAGVTLDVVVDSQDIAPVTADERVVRQILLNLLGNAVKFTERGGRVTLRASCERVGERQNVRFIVEDTGIGIDASEMQRIFEPFHRVAQETRAIEGTGLGLTITQRLVGALGGVLSVTSERGVGSRFVVDCSFDVSPFPVARAFSSSEISGYEGSLRVVLLADDDPDNRALVAQFLESVGFRVEAVADGREALNRLASIRPDIVLTDLVMPLLDGMALVRAIRACDSTRRIPVIALSASASEYTREEAIQAGCVAFLPKPVRLNELLEAIGEQLGIEWIRRTSRVASGNAVGESSDAFRLPDALATELQHLAMQGDVLTFAARVEAALADDESASVFCEQVRALAARYDVRGLREALASRIG
jgi:signal transduction histidine kinase/CheY-like chemotaxis protein